MSNEAKKGKVIVFEGVNGSGKSTQIASLEQYMSCSGYSHYTTRNPSDHPLGKLIREDYLLRKDKPDSMLMSLLLATDRYENVTRKYHGDTFNDYLKRGTSIIFDRYYLSSMVYNSDGTDEDMERVFYLNYPSIKTITPDLTILLDISPAVAVERVVKAGNPRDIFESGERIRKTCELYRKAVDMVSNVIGMGKFVIIPADDSSDAVFNAIWNEVLKVLKEE